MVVRTLGLSCVLLWAFGCDCMGDPLTRTCSVSTDCAESERCVDGRCQPVLDAGETGASDAMSGMVAADAATAAEDAAASDSGSMEEDATCGGENVPFDYRPPNVLLIFDRSCSMRRVLSDTTRFGTGPDDLTTRWAVARDGLVGLMGRFPTRVFWGLMAFPDARAGCDVPATAEVSPGPGAASDIETALRSADVQPFALCGVDNTDTTTQPRVTPTYDALNSTLTLPEMMDPARASFAIVVTDGGVSCGVSNDQLAMLSTRLRDAGIPTAVIGFTTGAEETTLEAVAAAGGLARPGGSPSYYVADDASDLDRVFDEIAARVVSCEIPLASTPPDPSMVFVNANDMPLTEDAVDGWTYNADTNAIVLHGAACARLRTGEFTRLSIAFGCPPDTCVEMTEVCNGFDDDCDDIVDEGCLI